MNATVKTLMRQIRPQTLVAIGARNGTFGDDFVNFQVTSSRAYLRKVIIRYDEAADAYDVECFVMNRVNLASKTESATGIYVEQLNGAILGMVTATQGVQP